MSIIRSIDRTDLGAGTVTVPSTGEGVILVGPNLQTPKDVSFIVVMASMTVTTGTGCNTLQGIIRLGSTTTGAQIGKNYLQNTVAGPQNVNLSLMVSTSVQATDYVQVCLTGVQGGASTTATVNGATLVVISF